MNGGLLFQDHRAHVDRLVAAALAAADPAAAVRRQLALTGDGDHLRIGPDDYPLGEGRLFVVAVGKAAAPMAAAALEELGERVAGGIVLSKQAAGDSLVRGGVVLPAYRGDHPVPGERSLRGTTAVRQLLAATGDHDLVLCLVSGGASALLTQPRVSLADWQALNLALLASGCPIHELNVVRQQLDEVKGGGLARLAAPARCISLILSDVVGSPLDMIGSGPTVPTSHSPADALAVLERYGIPGRLAPDARQRILAQLAAPVEASPLPPTPVNRIIGDVRSAAEAAAAAAAALGFQPHLLTARLEGEARTVGQVAAALAKDAPPGAAYLLGGETTVTIRGNGRGGRNQELALTAALALEGWPNAVVASFATDGEDGPTDAAGAVVTGTTTQLARDHGLDPVAALADNDSYTFFAALDAAAGSNCHLRPGSTGTNVNDLLFILRYAS